MSLRNGFTLGVWTVFPLEGRLVRDGESRRVQPKSMDVLLCLAEAGGEVVERETLLRRIWGERAVSDEPLTRCIGELRRAFGDTRSKPEYILTIPKRGYRLMQTPVSTSEAVRVTDEPSGPPLTRAQKTQRLSTMRKLAAGLAVLVLAALVQIGIERMLESSSPVDEPLLLAPEDIGRSIVVLPFLDMSASSDQEYMSDGISEELINLLARIPSLRVISRSSAFSFKGKLVDVGTIAKQLSVAYVLEGSVRKSGENIRITAQLIDARTDSHIWTETYKRQLNDIFMIQDDIAQQVVDRLEVTLLGDAPKSRPTDPEAYQLFLQARSLHEQPAGDAFQRAFDYYKAALEIDESYVPAWVWLAALYDDTVNSSGLPYEEVGRLARESIQTALEIDPDDPLALGMSAVLRAAWDNDLVGAANHMQRATALDPNNPILLRWAAIFLNGVGRHKDAIRLNEYLLSRDPFGNIAKINLASTYLMDGRNEEAVRLCKILVELHEESGPCTSQLILAYVYSGDATSALSNLKRLGGRGHTRVAPMVYYALGQQGDFKSALGAMQARYDNGDKGMAYWFGRTFAYTGDIDKAFEWLQRGMDDGVMNVSPGAVYFAQLEDDLRWKSLLEQLGKSATELSVMRLEVAVPE